MITVLFPFILGCYKTRAAKTPRNKVSVVQSDDALYSRSDYRPESRFCRKYRGCPDGPDRSQVEIA
jgi:hypothetical protein